MDNRLKMQLLSKFTIDQVYEGQTFSFDETLSELMLNDFARLTADVSPLHMDDKFAKQRGFKSRVVHGALLCGLVSRMIGVYLPGENCLLHRMDMRFPLPTYANDLIRTIGTIEHISLATRGITLKVELVNVSTQLTVARGQVIVGFTTNV